jgi:hypothetical protein
MSGEILLYKTEDGQTRVDVRLENETVWLSLNQLAELFQRDKSTVSRHIRNLFEEKELSKDSVVANFATTATDGKTYQVEHYNLDVIISVGYRVKSLRGTQFRIWATRKLREYLVKGFVLNDERFKQGKDSRYFDELLERIRDIRSSEKEFWRKVLDIYATSIDYDPKADTSQAFFATVQNKMHWAIHGQTAAEVVHRRADASKHNMGMTHIPAGQIYPRKSDIAIAKNYLNQDELEGLNRIVTLYLEFAEFQAMNRKAMTMQDWIGKLDQFLQISDRPILDHAGSISAEEAKIKASLEYENFRKRVDALPSPVEKDFEEALKQAKKIESDLKQSKSKPKSK